MDAIRYPYIHRGLPARFRLCLHHLCLGELAGIRHGSDKMRAAPWAQVLYPAADTHFLTFGTRTQLGETEYNGPHRGCLHPGRAYLHFRQ